MHASSLTLESALRCRDPRCATVLAGDAEVCDECGSSELEPLVNADALLAGLAHERPVAFALSASVPTIVGRASPGAALPGVDLSRVPDSAGVHRRHASLAMRNGQWEITHLGRNPVVIQRSAETLVVEPGSTIKLWPGDWIQFGRVRLRLVVPSVGLGLDG
jgi:FHA domain